MMSATTVSAGAASSGYYKAEGYYIAGSDEDKASAQWFGKFAQQLGLEGRVDDPLFARMLDGQTFTKGPDGLVEDRLMGRVVDGERQHLPGLDLTFSAPKSVSIAALVLRDDRVLEAHDRAVREAMTYVEGNLVQTRRQNQRQIITETGGQIIAGLFRHDTSRALDPQLHTHAVIVNQVLNSDSNVSALHNPLIFRAQKLGSEIYRDTLANELRELGYTVERTGKDRLISLAEIPKDLETLFSKRRQEIEKSLSDRDMPDNAKTAELAALATRVAKNEGIDRQDLKQAWRNEATRAGWDEKSFDLTKAAIELAGRSYIPGAMRDQTRNELARAVLDKAIAHVSERSSTYSRQELIAGALPFANQHVHAADLERAFGKALRDGSLISVLDPKNQNQSGQPLLTDRETLITEQKIVAAMRASANVATLPIGRNGRSFEQIIERRVDKSSMTDGQKLAVVTAMTGRSRIIGIQGSAGTGKTFIMSYIAKAAADEGYTVEGVAPSHQAVSQMRDAIANAETLQARLMRGQSPNRDGDPTKAILIVDEASMVSNRQMLDLMNLAEKERIARVVLVGDVKQLDGVAAGTPFDLLQKSGMPTAAMTDIIRQRDDNLKSAVQHAIAGEVRQAFDKIANNVHADPDYPQLAAERYLALSADERETAAIVTPSNKVRTAINSHVREGLREQGAIKGADWSTRTLEALHLSKVEATEPQSYRTGDVLFAHKDIKSQGIAKNILYEVTVSAGGAITLRNRETDERTPFDPSKTPKAASGIALFTEKETAFAAGDKVKFSLQDRHADVCNGDYGYIVRLADTYVSVLFQDRSVKHLPHNSLALIGMDHAYAFTGHGLQGATVDRIIVAMGANEYLANQKSFYVGISRARNEATLVTDDPKRLAERLSDQTGEKILALEAFEKVQETERQKTERKDQDEANRETDRPEKATPEIDKDEPRKKQDAGPSAKFEALWEKLVEQSQQQIERGEITR